MTTFRVRLYPPTEVTVQVEAEDEDTVADMARNARTLGLTKGAVTSVSPSGSVFVRYDGDLHSKATPPIRLDWVEEPASSIPAQDQPPAETTTEVEVTVTPYGRLFNARRSSGIEWKARVDDSGHIDAWYLPVNNTLDEARVALAVLTQAVAAAEAIRREGSA